MADLNLRQSGIYCIRNTETGRVYVGSAKNILRRWNAHRTALNTNKHYSKMLQAAWNKFGAQGFTFEILELVSEFPNLIAREQHWMDLLGAHWRHGGYNSQPIAGSNLGTKASAETKAKIKASWLNRGPVTAETRAKMSASLTGIKRSAETRALMSVVGLARNYKLSDVQKARVSAVHKGKTISDAQKEAVSRAQKGKPKSRDAVAKQRAAMLGREFTLQHRANISAARRRTASIVPKAQLKLL